MVFSHTTTAFAGRGSIIRGDVNRVGGTWNAASVTKGTIVTGGVSVLAYGLSNNATEKGLRSKKNVDEDGTTAAGSIGILAATSSDTGDWWADVTVN